MTFPDRIVFHAGTSRRDGRLVTAGGRVLTVVGRSTTYRDAIDTAYAAASRIHFDGMQYRRDIGRKALSGEVRRRHVWLPREPGGLAGHRRLAAGARGSQRITR